jgi:hypothetical protein
MSNRDEGRAIARQELRTKRASWTALSEQSLPESYAKLELEG